MEPSVSEESSNKIYKKVLEQKPTYAFLGIIIVMVLLLSAGFLLGRNLPNKSASPTTKKSEEKMVAGTVVYGYWKGDNSIITAIDLSTRKNTILAVLPTNIKHVKVVDSNRLLYLGSTDSYDYAKKIVLHTINPSSDQTLFEAELGFGIDDYVVSQNGKYIAFWMVEAPDGNRQTLGNKSKVYSLEVGSKEAHLIYDERSGPAKPVHYPLAITNSGKIFLDKFLPNSGAGWGYGMSTADMLGRQFEDIPSMKNGTYSTQPVVSHDGTVFAFAGYSGTDGEVIEDGFRKSMIMPNTLETLSLNTLERKKVNTGLSDAFYSTIMWDPITNNLLATATQKKDSGIEKIQLSHSRGSDSVRSITSFDSNNYLISKLSGSFLLYGEYFNSREWMGNLGQKYSNSFSKMSVVDVIDKSNFQIPFSQQPIQLISVEPELFFPVQSNDKSMSAKESKQIQLQTFEFKPTLAPVREYKQSSPPPQVETPTSDPLPECRTITYPQCNKLLGKNYPVDKDIGDLNDPAFSDCIWSNQAAGEASGTCMDSPLYLYGQSGSNVHVSINTELSNPNIPVQDNSFIATLDNYGKFYVDGRSYNSVTFDYVSKVKKLPRLSSGFLVKKEDLVDTLKMIAGKLKLNKKETFDVVDFANNINASYVAVGIFDEKLSKKILPIYFDPVPDIYRNIIFSFNEYDSKPAVELVPPLIEPIVRKGFTAIEISYIVR